MSKPLLPEEFYRSIGQQFKGFPRPRIVKHVSGNLWAARYRWKFILTEHLKWLVIVFLSFIQELICVLTLGLVLWDLRAYALFTLFDDWRD